MENKIRAYQSEDFGACLAVINDGAQAYQGVIPKDRWHDPYMTADYFKEEISRGVEFWILEQEDGPAGVMGLQDVGDVQLIRHAYVRTSLRNRGLGGNLLGFLLSKTEKPVLVGTWAAAVWAIRFYEKHGFTLLSLEEKDQLLRKYWTIPARQVETSVVLADPRWILNREKTLPKPSKA